MAGELDRKEMSYQNLSFSNGKQGFFLLLAPNDN